MLAEVDVFDAQSQTFEQAQAGAVEEFGLELESGVGDVSEDGLDFGFREDNGEAFVFLGAQGFDAGEFDVEDLFIEKEDGVHGHILGAGGDVFGDGEVGEEGGDVIGAQIAGMAEGSFRRFVEVDEAGDPMDVGLFGAVGVVLGADDVSDLIEEFGFGHRLPAWRALERSLPMRCLPYSEADYTSNLRDSKIKVSNLRLNN